MFLIGRIYEEKKKIEKTDLVSENKMACEECGLSKDAKINVSLPQSIKKEHIRKFHPNI